LAGDIAAWREAKDSVYGKVGDTLNIGNKPGETFKQKFIVEVVNGSNEDTGE
jgi:hypothetical protein